MNEVSEKETLDAKEPWKGILTFAINTRFLLDTLNEISTLVDKNVLIKQLDTGMISAQAVDCSHICMGTWDIIELPRIGEPEFIWNIKRMKEVVKECLDSESIVLAIRRESTYIANHSFNVTIPNPIDLEFKWPNIPRLTWACQFNLPVKSIRKFCKFANPVTEAVKILVSERSITLTGLIGKADEERIVDRVEYKLETIVGFYDVMCNRDGTNTREVPSKTQLAVYPLDYWENIFESIPKKVEMVHIDFRSDFPTSIRYIYENLDRTLLLAPRIEQ